MLVIWDQFTTETIIKIFFKSMWSYDHKVIDQKQFSKLFSHFYSTFSSSALQKLIFAKKLRILCARVKNEKGNINVPDFLEKIKWTLLFSTVKRK